MSIAITQTAEQPQIQTSWVVSSTTRVIRERFVGLALLALLLVALPQSLASLLPRSAAFVTLIAGLPSLIFQGAAALIACQQLSGGAPIGTSAALSAGAGRFGSLWSMGFLSGLAMLAGLLLLIVPGLFLMIAWAPATAVLMSEKETPRAALGRAWRLTQGSRWRLTGLLGILIGASLIALLVLMLAVVAVTLTTSQQATRLFSNLFLVPLFTALVTTLSAVGAAAAYVSLRNAKEGPSVTVASVFD